HHHERVAVPSQAAYGSRSALIADDFGPVRLQLELVFARPALEYECSLVSERRLAMVDSPNTALHRISPVAECAGLSVQDPFSGEVRFFQRSFGGAVVDRTHRETTGE